MACQNAGRVCKHDILSPSEGASEVLLDGRFYNIPKGFLLVQRAVLGLDDQLLGETDSGDRTANRGRTWATG